MEKGKTLIRIALSALLLITIFQTIFHFMVAGTGISNFYESGISGFSVGKLTIGEEFKANYKPLSQLSVIIIFSEWFILLSFSIFSFIKKRISLKNEVSSINIKRNYNSSTTKTDLDFLYEALQERKHLNISTIAIAFKIDKELALTWCKTLEEGNLATISYPRMGEPEVILNE